MLKKIIFSLIILFFASYGLLSYVLSNRILEPNSSLQKTKRSIKKNWGTTYEDIMASLPEPQIFTVNGVGEIPIKGKHFPLSDTADCAIIFAHGWSSTWAGMLKFVPVFEDCGCDLVLYDHRGHGESGNAYPTAGIREKEDLLLVNQWVKKELNLTSKQIGWVGASWGAATVLQAGATEEDVAFIVADSPYQDWYSAIFERAIKEYGDGIHVFTYAVMGLVNWRAEVDYEEASPLALASEITEPILLIHSQADSSTNSQQSVNIAARLKTDISTFHHLDWGNDHTGDVLYNREEYGELVDKFLLEKVGAFGNCNRDTILAE